MNCLAVEVRGLGVRFPGRSDWVFEDISLNVPRGCLFGIFGETGCGKSTLAQCLSGFVPADSMRGEILLHFSTDSFPAHAADPAMWRIQRGRHIAYIPQDPYKTLNPCEKVGKSLERVISLHGRRRSLPEILAEVGLPPRIAAHFPRMMSAGQRQRAMIAHALAVEPEILILDEPTASTDPEGREKMRECFQNLVRKGVSVVVISHEIDEYTPIILPEHRFHFSREASGLPVPGASTGSGHDRPPLLELRGIERSFGGVPTLRGLDLEVRAGEWIYLAGSNGAGKTTLLRTAIGMDRPQAGSIEWLGRNLPWSKAGRAIRDFAHPVFQDAFHALNPRLCLRKSIEEPISVLPACERGKARERMEFLLDRFEMPASLLPMLPHHLSYGQQKRAVLIRSLLKYESSRIRNPKVPHILLLDEVFAGINRTLRDRILLLLLEMRREAIFSVLWVAHGHEALRAICDRSLFLSEGRLIDTG